MVRPGGRGRGRGGDDPPPPPDYMAGMMQQFELNRQFMENIMAQFPQQNQNGHHHQHAGVNLHDFTRLNPTVSRTPSQPLDADDWLRDITHELDSAGVDPGDYVNFAAYHLKGPAARWWSTHKRSISPEKSLLGKTSNQLSTPATFLRGSLITSRKN